MSAGDFSAVAVYKNSRIFHRRTLKTSTEIVYAFTARRDKPERWYNNQPRCVHYTRAHRI